MTAAATDASLTSTVRPPRTRRAANDREPIRTRSLRIGGQVIVVAGILALLQWLVDSGTVAPIYLASPTQIVAQFPVLFAEQDLLLHTGITLAEGLLGTGLGVTTGVALGIWFGLSRRSEKFFSPFVSAVYAVPKVTLIPLLTLYLGIGFGHKVAVVFLFSLFVPLFNTIAGIKNVDERHLKVARAYGATRAQIIRKVILPSAAAPIVTAIRIEAASVLVITIFAEMVAAKGGLGFLVQRAVGLYDTPSLFALIIYVTLFAVAIIGLVNLIERTFLLRWKQR